MKDVNVMKNKKKYSVLMELGGCTHGTAGGAGGVQVYAHESEVQEVAPHTGVVKCPVNAPPNPSQPPFLLVPCYRVRRAGGGGGLS